MLVATVGLVATAVATVGAEGKEVSRLTGPSTEQPSNTIDPAGPWTNDALFHARAHFLNETVSADLTIRPWESDLILQSRKSILTSEARSVVSRSAELAFSEQWSKASFKFRTSTCARRAAFEGTSDHVLEG